MPVTRMELAEAEKCDTLGMFRPAPRAIQLSEGMTSVGDWATLWHEATHSALFDSGANNSLTDAQAEIVCDVMGTYLTAMMRAGELTVNGKDSKPMK